MRQGTDAAEKFLPLKVPKILLAACHIPLGFTPHRQMLSHQIVGLSTVIYSPRGVGILAAPMPKQSSLMDDRQRAICARVKHVRERIKWPQPDFAVELGISKDQLASIEYGRTPVRFGFARQLCFLFDIRLQWLATGDGPMGPYQVVLWTHGEREHFSDDRLFTAVYDFRPSAFKRWPKVRIEPEMSVYLSKKSGAHDAKTHLMRQALEWFEFNKFQKPEEEWRFVDAVESYATKLLFKIRRQGLATRAHPSSPKKSR